MAKMLTSNTLDKREEYLGIKRSKNSFIPVTQKREPTIQKEHNGQPINLTGFLKIFALILICVMLYRVANNSTVPTFESLLNKLASIVPINFPFAPIYNIPLLPDWLSWLGDIWELVNFFVNGIVSLIQYAFSFVSWVLA